MNLRRVPNRYIVIFECLSCGTYINLGFDTSWPRLPGDNKLSDDEAMQEATRLHTRESTMCDLAELVEECAK